ncbi:maleylpyruvate isomerase N-terminal domain-containing protein [Streptomyces alboflavus]|uniref:maleylpyruvate isomerase N-terminal domain-containing protein n=1 Tax=Streptomyces alboflavus TaxID=67267 RepID=UPI0004C12396|nr:maleylpyruvate isomerase N-terminal domain-containing protein [Streptomyces alboflavus]
MDSSDVREATTELLRVLGPHTDRDWAAVPAGSLEWSCRTTATHIAHDLLAYAGQVAARPDTAYLPFDLTVRPSATPADILRVVTAAAGLLATALDASPADARAWHWGPCDPTGFAAMGTAEILLHTHDITQGLAVEWPPPGPLCERVLARLFPDAPDGDPAAVLLWCTGRGDLDGRERRTSWVWQAALTA